MDLSIIIVNWNSTRYLKQCLASIIASGTCSDCEIIVADSGSFDGCESMLHRYFPAVRFIQCQHNVGFARANNAAAAVARGSTLLFLNPDTEVIGRAIDRLRSVLMARADAGIVGCRLLNTDGSLQTSCVQPIPTIANQVLDAALLQRRFPRTRLWLNAATFERTAGPVAVEAVSGACMMIERDVFEQLNGFSTDYFMYAEDLDLCWKARSAGLNNYYVADCSIVHHGGGSTRGATRFSAVMIPESVSRFLRKTRGKAYCFAFRLAISTAAFARLTLVGASLPVAFLTRRHRRAFDALERWSAVLSWGLGREKWAVQDADE